MEGQPRSVCRILMVFLFQLTVRLNPFTFSRETPRDGGGALQGNRAQESASNLNQRGDRPEKTAQQDIDFWFEDGNIIISCLGVPCFRVYRGLLAMHSEVFRDTFVVGNKPSEDELAGNAPVIDIIDRAEDMSILLRRTFLAQ